MRTILSLGIVALALAACGGGSANRTATRAPRDPPPEGPINARRVLDTCIPPAERPRPARDLPPARQVAIRDCVNAETARQYNEQLPLRVGQRTVMDQVSVAGPALVFRYSLAARRADLPPDFNQQLRADVYTEACSDAGFRAMVTVGGMQTYRYVDRDGTLIGEITVDRC
jgi:hypothetical protein